MMVRWTTPTWAEVVEMQVMAVTVEAEMATAMIAMKQETCKGQKWKSHRFFDYLILTHQTLKS